MRTARLFLVADDGAETLVGGLVIEVATLGGVGQGLRAVSPGGEMIAAALRLADPVDATFERLVDAHLSGRSHRFRIETDFDTGGGWRGRMFVDTINRCADTRVCELCLAGDGTPLEEHTP